MSDVTDPYTEQLEIAAARYVALQAERLRRDPRANGWGMQPHNSRSIVATAWVMMILRAAGYAHSSGPVQEGAKFLAKALRAHLRPEDEGGKGLHSRYAIWSIFGLTEYRQTLQAAPELEDALAWAVRWLRTAEHRVGGGWPDRVADASSSLAMTAYGALALTRARGAASVVEAARAALREGEINRSGAWRARPTTDEVSAPITALAVLALAGGNDDDRDAATRAKGWLLRECWQWERAVHTDGAIRSMEWDHMTFSLGLQACLTPGIEPTLSPNDDRLVAAIGLLEKCWDAANREWREGRRSRTSVRGSAAAVAAWEAIRGAQARAGSYPRVSSTGTSGPRDVARQRTSLVCQVGPSPQVIFGGTGDTGVTIPPVVLLGERWSRVRAIAELWLQQSSAQADGLTREDVAEAIRCTPANVERTLSRINADVREATHGDVPSMFIRHDNRYWFTAREVVIEPDA